MATDVDICNLALARLGDVANVVSINPPDPSQQANYCAKFYPMALSAMLDENQWSFTIKSVMLAQITNPNSLWPYCYACPSDLLGIIAIYDSSVTGDVNFKPGVNTDYSNLLTYALHGNEMNFSLEQGENGGFVIYTDQQYALLKYTSITTDASLFPPLFVDALAWRLVSYLAGVIVKGDVGVSAANNAMRAYNQALSKAMVSDAQNRKNFLSPVPSSVTARA